MRRYHPVLTAAAIRVSRQWGHSAPDEIDDIVQEIYLRICADNARILTRFSDSRPDAMFGYLKVVATNIGHDFFRRRSAAKRGAEMTSSVQEAALLPAPFEDMERRLSLSEIDDMLVSHTDQKDNGRRDRTVFRLYYRQGLTAQAIADLPGIGLTSKGVEGVLLRLTRAIRQAFGEPQELGAD
jgi:RNA polymerase sigma-70 factor (ECF subfamily)